jgi:hypothetical protein
MGATGSKFTLFHASLSEVITDIIIVIIRCSDGKMITQNEAKETEILGKVGTLITESSPTFH